jgi:membrane protein DedA with SNARE-associated domain
MLDWISNPYVWIFLFLVGTGAGLPFPEEVAIIYAGVAAAAGHLDVWLALGVCIAGALVGDCVMYWIGRGLGRGWLRHHPRLSRFFHAEHEQKMERILRRHGKKVFLVARFMVGFRGPLYLAAGIIRTPFELFLAIDIVCASVVVGIFFALSYFFGQQVMDWIQRSEYAITAVAIVAATAGVTYFLIRRHRAAQQELGVTTSESRAETKAAG